LKKRPKKGDLIKVKWPFLDFKLGAVMLLLSIKDADNDLEDQTKPMSVAIDVLYNGEVVKMWVDEIEIVAEAHCE